MAKSIETRVVAVLGEGGYRVMSIAYDPRDAPKPWTIELRHEGHLLGVRFGRTLHEALAAVQSIDRPGA